jgi:hypothetical protein
LKIRRRIGAIAVAAMVGLGGVVVAASPAYAANTVSCSRGYWDSSCTTGEIHASDSGHFIRLEWTACSGSKWTVWDTGNGNVVGWGYTGSGYGSTTIYGLYGNYRGRLNSCWQNRLTLNNW